MDNYQIFISYRREGGDALAGRLADRFNALGYRVFHDVESMRSGTFNTQILDAIATCDDVLLVLPPNALDRCVNVDDWVRQELAFALKHNKNIIPIIMRNFEFPKTLPSDIDKIRYIEGVTASSEYFDAVVERIESMLNSTKTNSELTKYKLETKAYFKIRTPLINSYKQNQITPKAYLNISVLLEKTTNFQSLHWAPPQHMINKVTSFRDYWTYMDSDFQVGWYDKNKDRLLKLRDIFINLKKNEDLYFYANALCYSIGMMIALRKYVFPYHLTNLSDILCYVADIPDEHLQKLEEAFYKDGSGFEEFRTKLLLPFEVWPKMHKSRLNSEEIQKWDSLAIMLFNLMIEVSIFILDNLKDRDLYIIITTQIRCYYKWLKKNKIFLPKELQEKIYRHL